jgi:hypothetical protein
MELQKVYDNHAEKFEKKFGADLSYENTITWRSIKNS